MDGTQIFQDGLRGGDHFPDVRFPLITGGEWSLAASKATTLTIVWVVRGVHCSFCKAELPALAERLEALRPLGCDLVVTSMDDLERAQRAASEWTLRDVRFGYGLSEADARRMGLYISTQVKPTEPGVFAEPGVFLVKQDGTLHSQFKSTAPWLRVDLDQMVRGIGLALERGTPPRGIA